MPRLRLQPLEGRELMSAAIDVGPAASFTAPIGSDKGSVVAQFTPPIGSNKGSFAGDGLGTALPQGSTQGIIAMLIGD